MSNTILEKLASKLGKRNQAAGASVLDKADENRVHQDLSNHLDKIAAAHTSSHRSNHMSTPD